MVASDTFAALLAWLVVGLLDGAAAAGLELAGLDVAVLGVDVLEPLEQAAARCWRQLQTVTGDGASSLGPWQAQPSPCLSPTREVPQGHHIHSRRRLRARGTDAGS
jgi:hypothetical protein